MKGVIVVYILAALSEPRVWVLLSKPISVHKDGFMTAVTFTAGGTVHT